MWMTLDIDTTNSKEWRERGKIGKGKENDSGIYGVHARESGHEGGAKEEEEKLERERV